MLKGNVSGLMEGKLEYRVIYVNRSATVHIHSSLALADILCLGRILDSSDEFTNKISG